MRRLWLTGLLLCLGCQSPFRAVEVSARVSTPWPPVEAALTVRAIR